MTVTIAKWTETAVRAPLLPKVLSPTAVTRLGMQNELIRQLKKLGVQVLEQHFDERLRIQIAPASAPLVVQQASCIVKRKITSTLSEYSVYLHMCHVFWLEVQS